MRLVRDLLIISLVTLGVLRSTTVAFAQEASQEQRQNQSATAECTTTAYGQSNCVLGVTQEQSQSQKVVYRQDGTAVNVHEPLETGVDARMLGVLGSMMLSSVALRYTSQKISA